MFPYIGLNLLLNSFIIVFYPKKLRRIKEENRSSLVIDAAMYDMSVPKEDIISASIIDQLPANRRTNGYGGFQKSFGHFFVEGYGKTMFYVYNDVGEYILIKLKDSNPGYIIMNEKTTEETRALYQNINDWFHK